MSENGRGGGFILGEWLPRAEGRPLLDLSGVTIEGVAPDRDEVGGLVGMAVWECNGRTAKTRIRMIPSTRRTRDTQP